jgi:5-hydroxyisourate hydrolase-like protein (transthyretin family)
LSTASNSIFWWWSRTALPGLLAVLLLCSPASPQAAPGAAQAQAAAPTGGKYRIAGTVTNPATGEPVRHAAVSLIDENVRNALREVETDAEGHFDLEGLAADKYGLMVTRRGYLTSFFNEHDGFSSAIVTGEGQDTEHIPFHLSPGAMIYGVVTDDAGEPVANAQVYAFLKARNGLKEFMTRPATAETDDRGAYELWDLYPGTFFLAVKATPWYALHKTGSSAQLGNDPRSPLDVAYPITYFDSATEEASATPIALAAGSREEINLSLHAVPALHLTVETPRKPDGSIVMPMLTQSIFGMPVGMAGANRMDAARTGSAEFIGVAPGHYELGQGDPRRATEFDASMSQQVDPTLGAPRPTVTVKARMASGAPLLEPLTLSLASDAANRHNLVSNVFAASPGRTEAKFESVDPGNWGVTASSGTQSLAVVSIEAAGKVHKGSLFQVADRPLTLTVTLVAGATKVLGFAMKENKPLPGIMIVLVPEEPGLNPDLFRRDQSDSDGSFALRDVAPGKYTVVAIEDGWELAWARPEVIGRYLPKGIPVTVTEQSGKLQLLKDPVPVQSR